MTTAHVPHATFEALFDELMEEIAWGVENQPRNLQTLIGPSEVGDPCDRALIAKMMGIPEPAGPPNWRAWVGTCMHNGLEGIFERWNQTHTPDEPRFLLEQKVSVGVVGDWTLQGSCDFFDTWSGSVVDWKSKSKTRAMLAKRHGLDQKYRVQFQSYGLGMANRGLQVNTVGGIFLLRDGELADSFQLSEPYNPQIALDALARANRLYALAQLLGVDVAMNLYPKCDEELCRYCGNYQSRGWPPPRREVQTTLAGLIAAG